MYKNITVWWPSSSHLASGGGKNTTRVHPPLHDIITLLIKYPSQKAANINDCSPLKQSHPCPCHHRCRRRRRQKLEVVYISYKHLEETEAHLNKSVISSISTPKTVCFSFHLSPNTVVPFCFCSFCTANRVQQVLSAEPC
jgi:hypothetical protein